MDIRNLSMHLTSKKNGTAGLKIRLKIIARNYSIRLSNPKTHSSEATKHGGSQRRRARRGCLGCATQPQPSSLSA